MNSKLFFILFLLISSFSCFAIEKKEFYAVKVKEAPKIDGFLNEELWQSAPAATDFIQNQTRPGQPCSQHTEVKLLYDDNAVYLGAVLHDVSRDSILREYGKRDTKGNTDFFGIILDTYRDGINAFGFFVTPAGVQLDARYSANGEDMDWNAVWDSQVRINDDSWVVEIMIPYSAIRFSKAEIQSWGVNFVREIRRHREKSFWNNVDPAVDGFVNQFGILNGISNIKSPVRLSLTPYVSAYADHFKSETGVSTTSTFNAGADIKFGINESFTLDLTLVPDFGQVQSDNLVLNLSPFEVQFNDFRPFFTEGTELFNRGGLFYSRRVGGTPFNYFKISDEVEEGEKLISNPSSSQLINASKVSGRTNGGLGIGLFNATTAQTFATIENSNGEKRNILTDPLSNYSVLVLDQSLKNNSYISIVNTNVLREGSFYDANVTGIQFRLMNKKITHAISGNGNLSQKYFPDRSNPLNGHSYALDFSKISGNFQYYLAHLVRSNNYDPRDLGFLLTNNEMIYGSGIRYNIYKPFWKVNNLFTNLGVHYSRRFEPNVFQDFNINGRAVTTFSKQFFSTGLGFVLEPIITYDYFEPRTFGRYYAYPTSYSFNYWFSSDYRKKFALDGNIQFRDFNENKRSYLNFGLSPRFRASDKLFFVFDNNNDFKKDDVGFVNNIDNQILFGIRNVQTITNTLTNTYTFTNRMALSLRIRHYWSEAIYSKFNLLEEDGLLKEIFYAQDHDVNFNAFNIDLVYVWNFAPGSEMTIVWKNAILDRNAEIYQDYFNNFKNTIESPQINSLSIKLLYYLDYLNVRRKLKK